MQLNRQQKEFVESSLGKNSLVLAGAGTGKTRVLIERLALLFMHQSLDPQEVMAITFTRKAANEIIERMRERMLDLNIANVESFTKGLTMGTFHSVFNNILKTYTYLTSGLNRYTILDQSQSRAAVKKLLDASSFATDGCEQIVQSFETRSVPAFMAELISVSKESLYTEDLTPLEFAIVLKKKLRETLTEGEGAVYYQDYIQDPASTAETVDDGLGVDALVSEVVVEEEEKPKDHPCPYDLDYPVPGRLRKEYFYKLYHSFKDLYKNYEAWLLNNSAFDYSDLLVKTYYLIKSHPILRESLQKRYTYIIVDECQDMNTVQYELIKLLHNPEYNCVSIIGDDDQAIYGFRGAEVELLDRYIKEFQPQIFKLEENYRCSPNILALANHVVNRHKVENVKTLLASKPKTANHRVFMDHFQSAEESFAWIVDYITQKARGDYRKFAILSRVSSSFDTLETALLNKNIPYVKNAGQRFYDKKEVKLLLYYLALLVNPDDNNAFIATVNEPKRSIGDKAIEKLYNYRDMLSHVPEFKDAPPSLFTSARIAIENKAFTGRTKSNLEGFLNRIIDLRNDCLAYPLPELLRSIMEAFHLTSYVESLDKTIKGDRLKNIELLIQQAKNFIDSDITEREEYFERKEQIASLYNYDLDEDSEHIDTILQNQIFNEQIRLATSLEEDSEDKNALTLSTIHGAKGLEWEHVFLIDFVDGVMPSSLTQTEAELQEERRLFYVGVTRAREELHLVSYNHRLLYGSILFCNASPYMEEILEDPCIPHLHYVNFRGNSFYVLPKNSPRNNNGFLSSADGVKAGYIFNTDAFFCRVVEEAEEELRIKYGDQALVGKELVERKLRNFFAPKAFDGFLLKRLGSGLFKDLAASEIINEPQDLFLLSDAQGETILGAEEWSIFKDHLASLGKEGYGLENLLNALNLSFLQKNRKYTLTIAKAFKAASNLLASFSRASRKDYINALSAKGFPRDLVTELYDYFDNHQHRSQVEALLDYGVIASNEAINAKASVLITPTKTYKAEEDHRGLAGEAINPRKARAQKLLDFALDKQASNLQKAQTSASTVASSIADPATIVSLEQVTQGGGASDSFLAGVNPNFTKSAEDLNPFLKTKGKFNRTSVLEAFPDQGPTIAYENDYNRYQDLKAKIAEASPKKPKDFLTAITGFIDFPDVNAPEDDAQKSSSRDNSLKAGITPTPKASSKASTKKTRKKDEGEDFATMLADLEASTEEEYDSDHEVIATVNTEAIKVAHLKALQVAELAKIEEQAYQARLLREARLKDEAMAKIKAFSSTDSLASASSSFDRELAPQSKPQVVKAQRDDDEIRVANSPEYLAERARQGSALPLYSNVSNYGELDIEALAGKTILIFGRHSELSTYDLREDLLDNIGFGRVLEAFIDGDLEQPLDLTQEKRINYLLILDHLEDSDHRYLQYYRHALDEIPRITESEYNDLSYQAVSSR